MGSMCLRLWGVHAPVQSNPTRHRHENGLQAVVPPPTKAGKALSDMEIGDMLDPVPEEEEPMVSLAPEWQKVYAGNFFDLRSLFPPLTWVPSYVRAVRGEASPADLEAAGSLPYSLKGDAIAGLTVGVMLVPQCLAFAMLAGLPVKIGLYASLGPLVVYAAFGTIRQLQVGPTALMSLLTGQALDAAGLINDNERIAGAAALAALVGAVTLLLGVVRFGIVVDFMSHTVMNAFCTAAGIIIATSQLKHVLGVAMERKKHWWQTLGGLASRLPTVDLPTAVLGFSLLAFLMSLKAWKQAGNAARRAEHPVWRWLPCDKASTPFRALKLLADFSSVASVVIGWFWGAVYRAAGIHSVKLIGDVSSNGFVVMLPEGLTGDQVTGMLVSAIMMAIVGFLETVAVGGKYAAQHRYSYDANQELVALGLANGASALMSGFPITGGFSRTAVNAMFGATSQLAGAMTTCVVVFAVYLLLDVVAYLPLAALAPLIIQGALGVTTLSAFKATFYANKSEFAVMLATLLVSLALSVKEGLFVGVVLSICKTLYEVAVPNLVVLAEVAEEFRDIRRYPEGKMPEGCVMVRMDAQLNFSNARRLREFCIRALSARSQLGEAVKFLIIDCKAMNGIDMTGCEMLEELACAMERQRLALVLANLKGPITRSLCMAGVHDHLWKHGAHLCWDMDQGLAIARGEDASTAKEVILDLDRRINGKVPQQQQL